MRASIVVAGVVLTACIAAAGPFEGEPTPPGRTALPATETAIPPSCREAAWPYVPAACMAQAGSRRVRVLHAEAGRRAP